MAADPSRPFTVAWFTYFPVEWLENVPEEITQLPRMHPATWQRVLLQEFQKDASLNIHVIVLRKHFARSLTFSQGNTTFHCVKVPGGLRAPSLFWTDTWQVSRLLKRIQPDLVHAWGTENGAAAIALRLNFPALLTMQGILSWLVELGVAYFYQRCAALLEKQSLSRFRHVTAESSFAVGYLKDHYPNLDLHQVEHAPHWLFHEIQRSPQLNPRRFVTVGTLGHPKGTDVLLSALELLCHEMEFELLVIGGGKAPVMQGYQRQFSTTLWSRLRFKNHLTSAQLADELSRACLMIYPTRADNSPNAVKEAVAAGLPVVASAVGGLVDYVLPGKNGFLFPAGDVQACRTAIREACSHPLLGQGLIEPSTLAQSRNYLSPATMAAKFKALYLRIADRPH